MTQEKTPPWLIASGDEGLQINFGTRLGFVGSGYGLPHLSTAIQTLRETLPGKVKLTSTQEDDWLAQELTSKNPNLYQEKLTALAEQLGVPYAGQFDYGDPRDLDDGLSRGHMVRPPKIHVADQLCFTVGGGEQTYNLRQFVISADYLHALTPAQTAEILGPQVDFYEQLLGKKLPHVVETTGQLADHYREANQQQLTEFLANRSNTAQARN